MKSNDIILTAIETNIFYIKSEIRKLYGDDFGRMVYPDDQMDNFLWKLKNYDEDDYPGKQKHDEYINSNQWRHRRYVFIEKSSMRSGLISCEICQDHQIYEKKSNNHLFYKWNIHHCNYFTFASDNEDDELGELSLLCADCHEYLHEIISLILNSDNRPMFKKSSKKDKGFLDGLACFKFGKYQGMHISEVPDSYLDWVENTTESENDLYMLENR